MLSRNMFVVSVVVLLVTAISTAPVEEKEGEEVELELEEGEEELSEEEEARGTQQPPASSDQGVSSLPGDSSQKQGSSGLKLNGDSSIQTGSDASSISSAGVGKDGGVGDPHAVVSFGSLGGAGDATHVAASSGSLASQLHQTGSFVDSLSAGSIVDTSHTGSEGHSVLSSSLEPQPPADTGALYPGTLSHGVEGGLSVHSVPHHVDAGAVGHSLDITVSENQTPPTGAEHQQSDIRTPTHGELVVTPSASPTEAPDYEASEAPEIEFNGNGQKLLNGGSDYGQSAPATDFHILDGTVHGDATGALEPFGGGGSHLDYTGGIDQSSHDFLIGLMGGVDPYGTDLHVDVSDPYAGVVSDTAVMGLDHLDPGVDVDPPGGMDPELGSSTTHPHPEPGPGDHIVPSIDQSGPDLPSVSLGSGQSSVSSLSDSSGPAHTANGGGNGRLSALTGTMEVMMVGGTASVDDLHTQGPQTADLTGAVEAVTRLSTQIDLSVLQSSSAPDTATGVGDMHVAVTDGHVFSTDSGVDLLHTESVDQGSFTTMHSQPSERHHGVRSQTDVGRTATEMITDTVTDGAQATPQGSGQTAAPEASHMAVSATEQYNPSGQGPEGAENVELEDTC